MTPGRDAIALARSIVSSEVTQTGHPGPCTSSNSGGSRRSTPYLTMLCVCPPQTSMIVQGRVTVRVIVEAKAPGGFAVAVFVEVFHGGGASSSSS